MKLFSLISDQPIVKTYRLDPKDLKVCKENYPLVWEFSSTEHSVNSIQDLHQVVLKTSSQAGCLLKGQLARPLISERRAGSTDSNTKTEWICLDIDGATGYQSVDHLLADIGLSDVDYVLQWSSSMGIEPNSGLRCHIFMLLDKPTHPQVLKQWLLNLNLTTKNLSSQLELTKSGNSLKWPLDVTTCQNDKLLYVASPKFVGMPDPYPTNRVTLELRTKRSVSLPPTVPSKDAIRDLCDVKINEIRTAQGMKKRRATKFKYQGTTEYMANPEQSTITEMKVERDFVYFNLNGGDSWGYYHPADNPAFIYNFKGEPVYRTQDLLPDYWARITERVSAYQPDAKGRIYLAFRDFRTSDYYNGYYDTGSEELKLSRAKSESQLRDFMVQHGQPLGEFIPDWEFTFDPASSVVIDVPNRVINTFIPSEYIKAGVQSKVTAVPVTINKLINHVFVNDQPTIEHFLNWLAVIVQTYKATGTAWIFHGTQGTGKGLLFHEVIKPLLGPNNVTAKRVDEIGSEFTGFLENKLIVFLDEMEVIKDFGNDKLQARLKNLIGEPEISVRHMFQAHREIKNFCNIIMSSNKPEPVEVPPNDRRYNITEYQTVPLLKSTTFSEADTQLLAPELQSFYDYLMTRPASVSTARWPIENAARARLKDVSRSAVDQVSDALLNGDLMYLWGFMRDPGSVKSLGFTSQEVYRSFRELMVEIVTTPPQKLSREQMYDIYEWCVGNMPRSPNKFTSLLKHHGITMDYVWVNNRTSRGISVTWKYDPAWLATAQSEISQGLV